MATQKQTIGFGLRLLTEIQLLQPDLCWSGPEKTKHKYQYKIWLSSDPSKRVTWGYSTTTGDNYQMFKRARTALRRELASKLKLAIGSGDVFRIKFRHISGAANLSQQQSDIVWDRLFEVVFKEIFKMTYADANAKKRIPRLKNAR
jgi:hypothetical protein